MNINDKNYDDIINMPHHVSKKHPQMSKEARAAQFAPFAALTGFEDEIIETSRITVNRKEINEELQEILNNKLSIIKEKIEENPKVTITYFKNDERKNGGKYITIAEKIKKIDENNQLICLVDGTEIPIRDIIEIN